MPLLRIRGGLVTIYAEDVHLPVDTLALVATWATDICASLSLSIGVISKGKIICGSAIPGKPPYILIEFPAQREFQEIDWSSMVVRTPVSTHKPVPRRWEEAFLWILAHECVHVWQFASSRVLSVTEKEMEAEQISYWCLESWRKFNFTKDV
jgi:hypothetical protein